jgi:hypothetical protein
MSNICRWTDEETDDNVMGSGAETWEWYITDIKVDDATDEYMVEMSDPNSEVDGGTNVYFFTRGKVRSTVTDMAMGRLPVNDRIRKSAQVDDLDADAMDCVIQWIVYGEIIFG